MFARIIAPSFVALAALVIPAFAFTQRAVAVEQGIGILKNNTPNVVNYQAGYADSTGRTHWQSFRLNPGESHTWRVPNPRRNTLNLQWDCQRGTGVRMTRSYLMTSATGFRSAFFVNGQQIWIDSSGGAR